MARKQAQFATKLEMSQTGLFDGSRNASSLLPGRDCLPGQFRSGPHAQPVPAPSRAGRPEALNLHGLRLGKGVAVSGRLAGPDGSARICPS